MDINALANDLYENSRAKGFYQHEDALRRNMANTQKAFDAQPADAQESTWGSASALNHDRTVLTEHFGNRLMLIAGEAVEAHEELRSGHSVAELYFSDNGKGEYATATHPEEQYPLKPEGVLMELVDVGVRTLETIAGILAQMTPEQKATLRGQVPQSEATEYVVREDTMGNPITGDIANVNVAELFVLKANYNAQRAAMHGRKF